MIRKISRGQAQTFFAGVDSGASQQELDNDAASFSPDGYLLNLEHVKATYLF